MSFSFDRLKEKYPRRYERLRKLFTRKGLSKEIRLLCSLSYLQAEGDWANLGRILDIYISRQIEYSRAYEVLLQGYLFCGYPRAIESFFRLDDVIKGKENVNLDVMQAQTLPGSEILLSRGASLSKKVHGDKSGKIRRRIDEICPDLGYLMIAEGYGHVLSRGGLESPVRELAVIASLTTLNAGRQLNSHIRGARNAGCGDMEIYEAIITGTAWIETWKVKNSCRVWSDIVGQEVPNGFDNIIF